MLGGYDDVRAVAQIMSEREFKLVVLVVTAAGLAVLRFQIKTIELGVENEVDDAGDGAAAVGRARAAGHGVDTLDDRFGEQIDVRSAVQCGVDDASPIQQCQRAVSPYAPQIQRAATR